MTAFTTSVVGSFPRPKWLIDAFERHMAGKLGEEEYQELVNDAVKLTIKEQELAGVDVITDGEQRRVSFVSFVGQAIPGFKLARITELNPKAMEIMKKLKAQLTLWRAVAADPISDAPMAVAELAFAKKVTDKPVKVTLPSPYLIMWEGWHAEISKPYYNRPEELAEDYVKILRKEIVRLREAGADFIQLDEPMIGDLVEAGEEEPDRYRKLVELIHGQKYRGFRDELSLGKDLMNEVVKGISGVRIGMHLDRWPVKGSPNFGTGYERLLPEVMDINVKQYVLEYASPGSGNPALFAEAMPSDKELGLGVIEVMNPTVEKPKDVVARAEKIVEHIDPERIWLNPDCGFAPGMFRKFERRIAFAKIAAMVKGARDLRAKYS